MIKPGNDIIYLERNKIDVRKWDECIRRSSNGLIYALSFYLDSMAENWAALVAGNYEMVMPLTWNEKYGFAYLYQPYFTKVLGVFADTTLPVDITPFLQAIPTRFKYWDIDINENNVIPDMEHQSLQQKLRVNHLLPLNRSYDLIQSHYKRLANRMVQKAVEYRLEISDDDRSSDIIHFYQNDYGQKHDKIKPGIYKRLENTIRLALENKLAETFIVRSSSKNLLAYYVILKDEKFIYSLLGGSTPEGRKKGAFYFVTDAIIRRHAGSGKIFRFEGSDIEGISFFNSQFGPEKITYRHLTMNRLPPVIRLLKQLK